MKIKKLFFSLVSVVCAFAIVFALAACNDKGGSSTLNAPTLSISGNVLSWNRVTNADSYEVYENNELVSTQVSVSYTIYAGKDEGTYTYAVKAINKSGAYEASKLSETRTFTVTKLAAPEISISADAIISWEEVPHADGYEVYEDSTMIAALEAFTSYTIQSDPGFHVYTVKATTTDAAYATSDPCSPLGFNVPLRVTIGIEFPASYTEDKVTVALFNGETNVAEVEVEVVAGSYGSAMFIAPDGNYVAKIVELKDGYLASTIRVSASVRQGIIQIIEGSEDDLFTLGQNAVTISESYGGRAQNMFIATYSGKFTVTVDGSKEAVIQVNGNSILDSSEKLTGTFKANEGEFVLIAVVASGADTGEFAFTITEGVEKQHVNVGSVYGEKSNIIEDSGTLYITITENATYTFQFSMNNMFGVTIKFTVGGKTYTFDDSSSFMNDITFEAGEDIEIAVTVSAPGSYTFYVFPPSANQD